MRTSFSALGRRLVNLHDLAREGARAFGVGAKLFDVSCGRAKLVLQRRAPRLCRFQLVGDAIAIGAQLAQQQRHLIAFAGDVPYLSDRGFQVTAASRRLPTASFCDGISRSVAWRPLRRAQLFLAAHSAIAAFLPAAASLATAASAAVFLQRAKRRLEG